MNEKIFSKKNFLKIILWLVAVHSAFVGIALIISPSEVFEILGYQKCTERFFPTQGGVFHIIMAVGYGFAANRSDYSNDLIVFSIIVKLLATLFLITYFILVMSNFIILFSALGDFIMGILIWWSFLKNKSLNEK